MMGIYGEVMVLLPARHIFCICSEPSNNVGLLFAGLSEDALDHWNREVSPIAGLRRVVSFQML